MAEVSNLRFFGIETWPQIENRRRATKLCSGWDDVRSQNLGVVLCEEWNQGTRGCLLHLYPARLSSRDFRPTSSGGIETAAEIWGPVDMY